MSDRRWSVEDMPSQEGRVAVITGANSGLGLASAAHLLRLGAHVVMACRNAEKAQRAAHRLRAEQPGARVDVAQLDLSSLSSVHRCAEDLRSAHPKIDILMNNAGVMAVDHGLSEDGYETQFATNHLGHFALTALLFPTLSANPDGARIVNVSSMSHRFGRINLDDPNYEKRRYQRWGAYGQSKLANLLFTAELNRRLTGAGSSVTALGAHPGTATTELGKVGTGPTNWVIRNFFGVVSRGPDTGALSQVRAAVDTRSTGGQFYGPRLIMVGRPRLETPSRRARDEDDARALWELSQRLTGITFPV